MDHFIRVPFLHVVIIVLYHLSSAGLRHRM